ncbi:MAG TPA: GNAT family N-acetyltransferase [Rhizomicrobium sp.]
MTTVALRFATQDGIPFILATERGPGYASLVGRFEEDEHRAHMADDDWLYLIGMDAGGDPRGFALLQHRRRRDGSQFLRRIAVVEAGKGFGRPFLSAVIDWVFADTDADRVRLHVRKINVRARHVYTSLGFVEDPDAEPEPDSGAMVLRRADWPVR